MTAYVAHGHRLERLGFAADHRRLVVLSTAGAWGIPLLSQYGERLKLYRESFFAASHLTRCRRIRLLLPTGDTAHSIRIAGEPGKVRPMPFTVYGEHPGGGHSEYTRDTAIGAVFKAADLMGDGWTSVHIGDERGQIFWPDQFDLVRKSNA